MTSSPKKQPCASLKNYRWKNHGLEQDQAAKWLKAPFGFFLFKKALGRCWFFDRNRPNALVLSVAHPHTRLSIHPIHLGKQGVKASLLLLR
jgi:hypothetical protein